MKSILLAAIFTFTAPAFARQYIQCSQLSETTDVAVVNLETSTNGTLFLSSGMQNPEDERNLVTIQSDKRENNYEYFNITTENVAGFVAIPTDVLGKSADSFVIEISFTNYRFDYSCFSRIYND
jgi:hypothetical protein